MANVQISDLALATTPLDEPNTFIEVQAIEGGIDVSRKISVADLTTAFGLDASFVTVGLNAGLPNERVITAGNDISLTDGGAGSTITIDVTGGGALPVPTISGSTLRGAGGTFMENRQLQVTGQTITGLNVGETIQYNISHDDTRMLISENGGLESIRITLDSIMIDEVAAAPSDLGGSGQVWVRSDTPNTLMFTDDAGTDFEISGGVPIPASVTANALLRADGAGGWAENNFLRNASVATAGILEFYDEEGQGADLTYNNGVLLIQGRDAGGTQDFVEIRTTEFLVRDDTGARNIIQTFDGTTETAVILGQLTVGCAIAPFEIAAAFASTAGRGQIWIRNDTPNNLMFTDDAGTDFVVAGALSGVALLAAAQTFTDVNTFTGAPGIVVSNADASIGVRETGATADEGNWILRANTDLFSIQSATDAAPTAGDVDLIQISRTGTAYLDTIFGGAVKLTEQAAPVADTTGAGQIWVESTTPNILRFTDDAGNDFTVAQLERVQSFTVAQTFLDDIINSQAIPKVRFQETGLGADLGNWLLRENGADIGLYTATDAAPSTVVDFAWLAIRGATTAVARLEVGEAVPLRIQDSLGTSFVDLSHDTTDFNLVGTSSIAFDISGFTRVRLDSSVDLRMVDALFRTYDAAEQDFLEIRHTGTEAQLNTAGTGGGSVDIILNPGNSTSVLLEQNTVTQLTTQINSSSGNTTGIQIADHGGNLRDAGFNVLPIFNDNVSDTLEAEHCGQVAFKDTTTARTLTLAADVDLDFPVEGMTTVINAFTSTDYTITEGASTTLFYLDGSTRIDTAGGCTVGPGGVANIWRESATVYYIWGTGITP